MAKRGSIKIEGPSKTRYIDWSQESSGTWVVQLQDHFGEPIAAERYAKHYSGMVDIVADFAAEAVEEVI